ncbi:hypothetical protein Dsin_001054 [Dipteronia sinensis]|uniref:Reverse transcriptase domain-containing protein n=1 Tax=Dipteronia sinensis TaxID=43782 RepID=A0AAE0B412_9ROSI|nr:hypothetical protein Dsin_001054 [Dipteronia sinensis]
MAFVRNRQIIDGFVIAEEIIHKWKKDKEGGLLVKLDFKKAYDSIDHYLLDHMMEGMGFGFKWRNWMWNCISSPSLSVLGLNCLFRKAADLNMLRGVVFGNNEVHISHLQFADDIILFLQPNMDYLFNARRILKCFELVSGLRINFHKSCVVTVGRKGRGEEDWAACFKCKSASLHITYLGLPLGANFYALASWKLLIRRVENRLTPCKRKFINNSGHLVLIKGDGVEKRKLYLANWSTVCKSKVHEGLRIGRILDKNRSLLTKWLWRFGREDSSLWKRVLCAKYGVSVSSLCWDWWSPSSSSHFVKAIDRLLHEGSNSNRILKEGFQVIIGIKKEFGQWVDDKWTWKVQLRRQLFDWEREQWKCFLSFFNNIAIRRLFLETIEWSFDPNRIFTVRSFNKNLECLDSMEAMDQCDIWQGICPPKVEVFAWQLMRRRIPVKDVFLQFGFIVPSGLDCILCNSGSSEPLTSIMVDISARCIDAKKTKKTKLEGWMPPSLNSKKFNVDSSTKGASGPARMGGVLRDSNGKILCIFSSFLGVKDDNSAEIEAIHRAYFFCVSKGDLRDRRIAIVSDSKTTVSWVNEGDFGNLKHFNLIYDIHNMLNSLSNTIVLYNSRATNFFADLLAKMGPRRSGDFVQWGDV